MVGVLTLWRQIENPTPLVDAQAYVFTRRTLFSAKFRPDPIWNPIWNDRALGFLIRASFQQQQQQQQQDE